MTRRRARFGAVTALALLCSLPDACSDVGNSPFSPGNAGASFAKASSTTVSVSATDPSFGDQGQTSLTVTITGSGFKDGATADWLYNGAVDPTITVSSPHVVNSTTMTAVLSIAPNSPLDFRDVLVTNTDRTHGIGAALFEVTQARVIPGTQWARGVNDNGEVTGSLANGGVFYYNISTGELDTVSSVTTATGYGISPSGDAISGGGVVGNASASLPQLYTRSGPIGTAWSATALPVDPNATSGTAGAMVTDPVTGQVTLLGGVERFATSRNCTATNAIIWSRDAVTGAWQRNVLPKNGACQASVWPRGLSANGTAVGYVDKNAAVWMPDGSGGYTLTLLGAGHAYAINDDATMIVGQGAAYWTASNGGWSSATQFVGGCVGAVDIADANGRVTLNDCPFAGTSVLYAAYMDTPYATPTKLGGVGGHNNDFVGAISPSGQYLVGTGTPPRGQRTALYWRP